MLLDPNVLKASELLWMLFAVIWIVIAMLVRREIWRQQGKLTSTKRPFSISGGESGGVSNLLLLAWTFKISYARSRSLKILILSSRVIWTILMISFFIFFLYK